LDHRQLINNNSTIAMEVPVVAVNHMAVAVAVAADNHMAVAAVAEMAIVHNLQNKKAGLKFQTGFVIYLVS